MKTTISDIEHCLRILANLCEAYGEEYWATFELFEKDLEGTESC
jgi:hypothetical protein